MEKLVIITSCDTNQRHKGFSYIRVSIEPLDEETLLGIINQAQEYIQQCGLCPQYCEAKRLSNLPLWVFEGILREKYLKS